MERGHVERYRCLLSFGRRQRRARRETETETEKEKRSGRKGGKNKKGPASVGALTSPIFFLLPLRRFFHASKVRLLPLLAPLSSAGCPENISSLQFAEVDAEAEERGALARGSCEQPPSQISFRVAPTAPFFKSRSFCRRSLPFVLDRASSDSSLANQATEPC